MECRENGIFPPSITVIHLTMCHTSSLQNKCVAAACEHQKNGDEGKERRGRLTIDTDDS